MHPSSVIRPASQPALKIIFTLLLAAILASCIQTNPPSPPDSPLQAPPVSIQTAVAGTQPTHSLTGSVEWEDGRCCAGGTAGETIQVQAGFSASSPQGAASEMRVRTGGMCFQQDELDVSAWEPLVAEKSYPFTLPINWVGFYITVQYRDQAGNLSPVYCDDISLEGMPAHTP